MRSGILKSHLGVRSVPCAPEHPGDLVATQRAAILAIWLYAGRRMTAREIEQATGLSSAAVWNLTDKLSDVLPIVRDDDNGGRWQWVDD